MLSFLNIDFVVKKIIFIQWHSLEKIDIYTCANLSLRVFSIVLSSFSLGLGIILMANLFWRQL